MRRVSRLKAVARGLFGSVACSFMVERILSREGEARTWSMYHIVAGRGFAYISERRIWGNTSNANSMSNIPNPASAAV